MECLNKQTINSHNKVSVQAMDGHVGLVDEGIAELIRALVEHKCNVIESCEEKIPGRAWILFSTPKDCARFLDMVARYPKEGPFEDSLYGRIVGAGSKEDWGYNIVPRNYGFNDFDFWVEVTFPVSDIQLLVVLMESVNDHP